MVLPEGPEGFEVEYVDADGVRRRVELVECWAEPFGRLPPARTVRTYPGQNSVTRQSWAATTRGPLLVESQLERHHAMLLDFDPQVTGLAAQPFRLRARKRPDPLAQTGLAAATTPLRRHHHDHSA
ncbi:hypothetical protein [Streptomyces durhamensis]|uniref:hypothetical protein n=1 Tax=Streptomyces durhamensis TaxID=68194 RepID=UPI0014289ACC|nr:hypothetical protein [Streptomyces durhamensis]